jgi:hypothetical protein
VAERSITGDDRIDELDRLATGVATRLCCDNGPEVAAWRWPTGPVNASACISRLASVVEPLRRVVHQQGPR